MRSGGEEWGRGVGVRSGVRSGVMSGGEEWG